MSFSRRDFLAASALACSFELVSGLPAVAQGASLNVGTVIDRIKQHVGVPWRTPTVDRLITGTPDTHVTGVATTMMATFDVCKRAQAAGCNLVVTHEPTFYLHEDLTTDIADNPVVRAKQTFLSEHGMAVFRLHDNIHGMHPDGINRGMLQQLGWQAHVVSPEQPHRLHFDGVPLSRLAQELANRLHDDTIRVVGDPNLPVHAVYTNWGYCSREAGIRELADPATELVIAGEAREWEVVEYAQDAITAGQKKALILLGHVRSEQGGMIFATDWLKSFITEVPVVFVPATEPFWRPDAPRQLGA